MYQARMQCLIKLQSDNGTPTKNRKGVSSNQCNAGMGTAALCCTPSPKVLNVLGIVDCGVQVCYRSGPDL